MSKIIENDESSIPLTDEEKAGLIPAWITIRKELNEVERKGILNAEIWLLKRKQKEILTESFIKKVHYEMFKEVWVWAGKFRLTEKNLGVPVWQITEQMKILLDDTKYWIDNKTYPVDEIGARFHHRLFSIHAFPNGNGRHSRLMSDILMKERGCPRFSWGRGSLIEISELRTRYIQALKSADNHDIKPLLEFVRLK